MRRDLDTELQMCLMMEKDAIPERVLTPIDGVGENLIVLGYEVGAVDKDYIYSCRSEDDETRRARAANAITELQDVVCQALVAFAKFKKTTHSMYTMTVDEFIRDGLERQQERMREVKSKVIDFKK